MKIRSLLLGSVAAAGLATTGYAADLGVVTSLDICDELGLSGLTISSDENCLVITGEVAMEYSLGDYAPGTVALTFDRTGGTWELINDTGPTDATLDVDAWLQFAATSSTDFGNAWAVIKLLSDDNNGVDDDPDPNDTDEWDVQVDKAWVGIGDVTVLEAGKKDSIFMDSEDKPLNYLGLFNSSQVDAGVGFSAAAPATGGVVIQLSHNLGNGLKIKGGIENLQTSSPAILTGVGTISYEGDGVKAHVSGAVNTVGLWKTHAAFEGTWDPITVVGAVAANNGWWNALGSVKATIDMFELAVSGEATSGGEYGVGGSVGATVSDGVKINLGGRWFSDTTGGPSGYQVEAGVEASVTETIKLTAAVGATDTTLIPPVFYGKAGVEWSPGGGFTAGLKGEANTLGGYKGTFNAKKTIK